VSHFGLLVALYFLGAINQDLTSTARVIGLSILLGYQAPNIWSTQERIIYRVIDRKINSLLSKATSMAQNESNDLGDGDAAEIKRPDGDKEASKVSQ
jgi:hypothetical protein